MRWWSFWCHTREYFILLKIKILQEQLIFKKSVKNCCWLSNETLKISKRNKVARERLKKKFFFFYTSVMKAEAFVVIHNVLNCITFWWKVITSSKKTREMNNILKRIFFSLQWEKVKDSLLFCMRLIQKHYIHCRKWCVNKMKLLNFSRYFLASVHKSFHFA